MVLHHKFDEPIGWPKLGYKASLLNIRPSFIPMESIWCYGIYFIIRMVDHESVLKVMVSPDWSCLISVGALVKPLSPSRPNCKLFDSLLFCKVLTNCLDSGT